MVDSSSHRFVYERSVEGPVLETSAIRDIATVYDCGKLLQITGYRSKRLEQAMLHTTRYYSMFLERKHVRIGVRSDPQAAPAVSPGSEARWATVPLPGGEEPSVAHSAFLILALLAAAHLSELGADMKNMAMSLGEGLWRQRVESGPDAGRIRIHFTGVDSISGEEFYPGEAMLALAHVFPARYAALTSNLGYYMGRLRVKEHSPIVTFFVNWLAQSAEAIHAAALRAGDITAACEILQHTDYLADVLLEGRLLHAVRQRHAWPHLATVEVAVAAEACAHCLAILRRHEPFKSSALQSSRLDAWTGTGEPIHPLPETSSGSPRTHAFDVAASIAVQQRREDAVNALLQAFLDCTVFLEAVQSSSPECGMAGGFPQGFRHPEQRIDVTGHVVNAMARIIEDACQGGREGHRTGGDTPDCSADYVKTDAPEQAGGPLAVPTLASVPGGTACQGT